MKVALRAHHLLCLLTYAGKGYSAAFVRNFDHVARRVAEGAAIVLVAGPDAVCAPLCGSQAAHCTGQSALVRDARAARVLAPWLGSTLDAGTVLELDAALLARLRAAYARGRFRDACAGCEWAGLCRGIAARGFPDVRLWADWMV